MIYCCRVIDMARTARQLSKSNIYHVMLRGVNRQVIFEDDEDRIYFMTVLRSCKERSGFRLHAFVLMPNHVHLLIEPKDEPLDLIFRRLGTRYAVWYNKKHRRVGHLFQDRFRSENVETDLYFMTVLRYILQNPIKAGLESIPGTYRWSSYPAYKKGTGAITDTEYATEVFGGRETLVHFLLTENEDQVMDEEEREWRLRDDEAQEIMTRITHCDSPDAFRQLDPISQKQYVWELYQENLSGDQISRLTGVPRSSVYRTLQKQKPQPEEEEEIPILRESSFTDFVW